MQFTPTILVLDGGHTSAARAVARAIRALGVFTLICPANKSWEEITLLNPAKIILIKGPVALSADVMNKIDLVLDGAAPNLPGGMPETTGYKLFWGDPEIDKRDLNKLAAFLDEAKLERSFYPEAVLPVLIEEIKNIAGNEKVLLALSGGVDSSVCAALIHRAIGQNLLSVFVDTGLMRAGEVEGVNTMLKDKMGLNLLTARAKDRFLAALAGVCDPEEKRKIIGRIFIEVFQDEAASHNQMSFLGQGTIYPDIIESVASATGGAPVKSHHNVGGLPEKLNLKLLEPLKYLFKDEVRAIGLALGLDREVVFRQPFPGPGLGVRCVGEVTEEKLELLRAADLIVRTEIEKSSLPHKPWQYFAIILPVKSVGARDHARSYGYTCVVRAIETVDAMTAVPSELPYKLLMDISNQILKQAPGFTRVLYDMSAKPPGTIEWE